MNRPLKKFFRPEVAWPMGIIAALAIFISINLAFVTVALEHRPELVSEHYYSEGYNLKGIAEREAASEATGWQVAVRCLPAQQADMPLAELTAAEASGEPCDSLAGEVGFYRPSNKTLDLGPIPIQYVGTGRYLVYLPRSLERGSWQALVHLQRGRQEFSKRISMFVDL